jgi:hypothetical protein
LISFLIIFIRYNIKEALRNKLIPGKAGCKKHTKKKSF